MTTKTERKPREVTREAVAPTPEQLKAAHEIHTLVQLVGHELATTRPWVMSTAPGAGWTPAGTQHVPVGTMSPWTTGVPWGC